MIAKNIDLKTKSKEDELGSDPSSLDLQMIDKVVSVMVTTKKNDVMHFRCQ